MARPVQQSQAQSGGNRGATGSNVVGQGTTARQFAIDEHTSDREGQVVVRGTILLHSSCARVLFDTGASLSVISFIFALNLGLIPEDSGTFIQFDTITGSHTIPKHICYKMPFYH